MLNKIRDLQVGQSIKWENCPLSCGMVSNALGDMFSVRWITTNWEASFGYLLITRVDSEERE